MKALTAALLLLCGPAAAQELRLPFDGRWFTMQAGDTPNVNHHMTVAAQAFGVDFVKVGGPSQRALASGAGTRLEDFYSWGAEVLSPADGVVVAVENDLPDLPLGTKDPAHPAGNHVVLQLGEARFLFLGHLQQGSVAVAPGDTVRPGQLLGRCGNSGNSDLPHVHLHLQDTPTLNRGRGLNPVFGPIDVELTGKRFSRVSWPLIRGLFVSNP